MLHIYFLIISYFLGEVALHRLNWLKVWVLAPPGDSVTVKGIAWRPDAKVIAIGYSTSEFALNFCAMNCSIKILFLMRSPTSKYFSCKKLIVQIIMLKILVTLNICYYR